MKQLENSTETRKVSLETLIIIYELLVALRSLSKEIVFQVQKVTTWYLQDWPPRSPDITPCDFYLGGYVKDQVCQPPMPQSIPELQDWISQAAANGDGYQLRRTLWWIWISRWRYQSNQWSSYRTLPELHKLHEFPCWFHVVSRFYL
jgi:hypothetical protein